MPLAKNKQIALSVILLLGVMTSRGWTAESELKADSLYNKVVGSIATIKAEDSSGNNFTGTAFSAFNNNIFVTAWHLVKNKSSAKANFSNGDEYDVLGIIDYDESKDIALIKINVNNINKLALSNDSVKIGSKVYTIGTPRGLEFSISDGLLSQIQTIKGNKVYQFTSPTSQGSSGGPLLNASGKVIGVVTSQYKEGQNINFATPSLYVQRLINNNLKNNALIKQFVTINKSSIDLSKVSSDNYDKLFISKDFWKYVNWKEFDKNPIVSWLAYSGDTGDKWSTPKGKIEELRRRRGSNFFGIPVEVKILKQGWGGDYPYLMSINPDIEGENTKINGDMWRKILGRIEKELGPYTIKNDFSDTRDKDSRGLLTTNTRSQFDIGETRIKISGLFIDYDNTAITNILFIAAGHNSLIETDIQASYIKCSQLLTTSSLSIQFGEYQKKAPIDDAIYIIDEKEKGIYSVGMEKMKNVIITKDDISWDFPTKKGFKFDGKANVNRITGQYRVKMDPIERNNPIRSEITGQCEKIESLIPKF